MYIYIYDPNIVVEMSTARWCWRRRLRRTSPPRRGRSCVAGSAARTPAALGKLEDVYDYTLIHTGIYIPGSWFQPLWKNISQLGWLSPIDEKINMFQTTNHYRHTLQLHTLLCVFEMHPDVGSNNVLTELLYVSMWLCDATCAIVEKYAHAHICDLKESLGSSIPDAWT